MRKDRPVGYQKWRSLLFLHWDIPAAAIQPLLPPGLALDLFDGRAWVGLVAFTMRGVRPWWSPPLPGLSHFHELNVRTYVRHESGEPGVWFFSLDAANSVAVLAARASWGLPYHRASMRLVSDGGLYRYSCRRRWPGPTPAVFGARWREGESLAPPAPDSLEHFLVERYHLYVDRGKGRLESARVHHSPYPLKRALLLDWRESMLPAAGLPAASEEPHVLFSPGVDVDIHALRPLELSGT